MFTDAVFLMANCYQDSNGGSLKDLRAQFLHCAHGGMVDIVKVCMCVCVHECMPVVEGLCSCA